MLRPLTLVPASVPMNSMAKPVARVPLTCTLALP